LPRDSRYRLVAGLMALVRSTGDGQRQCLVALGEVDRVPLILGEAAPHAVRLAHGECMPTALLKYWASGTDGLGHRVAIAPSGSTLTFGVEEEPGVRRPAGTL